MFTGELFPSPWVLPNEQLAPHAWVLRGCALPHVAEILVAVAAIESDKGQASPRPHWVRS